MTNYNKRLDEMSKIDLRQGDCLELMKDIQKERIYDEMTRTARLVYENS